MSDIVRIPITNVIGGGDYTARITVGSAGAPVDVILDTGSSTLAVKPTQYDPSADAQLKATPLAQEILYGTGGWAGPVVQTQVTIGTDATAKSVQTYLAITDAAEPGDFGNAGGILGLAYNVLNNAYDFSAYLTAHGTSPANTYPWPFHVANSAAGLRQFDVLLHKMPEQDLPPYFTALKNSGVVKDTFAFYTLRSFPSMRHSDPSTDPLNNGWFILGGGDSENDLYTGDFVRVDVVDDAYYNTDLIAVKVGDQAPVPAQPLSAAYAKSLLSNSIVDSGTNALVLAPDVYQAVLQSLHAVNPQFTATIDEADNQPTDAAALHLDQWPDITFVLKGVDGADVSLTCAPSTYWQVDFPQAGQAVFQITGMQMPQSILGLPLLNNYFTVFDRSADPYGEIRFAPIAAPAGD